MTLTTDPGRPSPAPVLVATDDAHEIITDPHQRAGTIAPGTPRLLYPVNPWLPWVTRVGLAAMGVCLAAAVTFLLGNGGYWQVAAVVIAGMVFAFVVFGHEQCAKRPARFATEAP